MNKNYQVIDKKWIDELKAQASYLRHKKTGAQVLVLDNGNVNKTFAIGFKTPPEDSTGVAHIVEHSVLSGSRKYRTKEPFMDLIQSSLQTFLNAMTYPDKTLYPISSRNTKDFYQLMDVYLDSVFYPRMYDLEEVFKQEGHHMEIHDGVLTHNGVVYNEMKGVYGDPTNRVSDLVREALHPEGTYSHDSGGNPKNIPDLTYQAFLDFHRTHYHPSNSFIFLAGDLDFGQALEKIDKDYLANFDYQEPQSEIQGHAPFDQPQSKTLAYPISKDEYREDKAFFALAWDLGELDNLKDWMTRSFLAELLVQSEAAPIKTRLLEAGIGEDVYVELSTSNRLDFTLYVHHAHPDRYGDFLRIVKKTLEDLVNAGIDKEELEAVLNKFEFSIRQGGDAHKDLITYIQSLNLWLYGKSPLEGLEMAPALDEMREAAKTSYYEDRISDWFIDSNKRVDVLIRPDTSLKAQEDQALKDHMAQKLEAMTPDEVQKVEEGQEKLFAFQMADDSPEAKATIPRLDLEDIGHGLTPIPREEDEISGVKTILSDQPTNGITYLKLAFDISHLNKEDLFYASLLSALLTRLATKKWSLADLNKEIFLKTGGIQFSTPVLTHKNGRDYTPYMVMTMASLDGRLDQGLGVLEEVMTSTRFDQAQRNREALTSTKTDFEAGLLPSGHSHVADRLASYFKEAEALDQWMNKLDFYFELAGLLKAFDNDRLEKKLLEVYSKVFLKNKLTIQLIGDMGQAQDLKKTLEPLISGLKTQEAGRSPFPFDIERKNEALTTSSPVNYVSKGYDLQALGLDFTGDLRVLASILSSTYLHNSIRAKGGAYGAGIRIGQSGAVTTYSYRDPNLKKTLEVYDGMGDFVRGLDLSERDLADFIIGTMNSFDPHLSPLGLANLDMSRYLTGTDLDYLKTLKDQALTTDLKSLKDRADLLDSLMEKDFLALIGNEEAVKENKELFGSVKPLIK